ncbi:MAG: hypothetical protein NC338_04495 [Firmicutes bacterium]|nr:hypothetical protein [Bacillota bacterium]MCM1401754.1 hypothetical protein [Bacteroides sp.]
MLRRFVALGVATVLYFANVVAQTPATDALSVLTASIEALADYNEIEMKVSHSINGDTLLIQAEMTDEEDSIDYIAGYLDREGALKMLGPVLSPVLASMPGIAIVQGTITDANGQFMTIKFTAEEITSGKK